MAKDSAKIDVSMVLLVKQFIDGTEMNEWIAKQVKEVVKKVQKIHQSLDV